MATEEFQHTIAFGNDLVDVRIPLEVFRDANTKVLLRTRLGKWVRVQSVVKQDRVLFVCNRE